jgi:hypothetical protein
MNIHVGQYLEHDKSFVRHQKPIVGATRTIIITLNFLSRKEALGYSIVDGVCATVLPTDSRHGKRLHAADDVVRQIAKNSVER